MYAVRDSNGREAATVRTYTATLGGGLVTIRAPRPGEHSQELFDTLYPAGLYGLDVETTSLTARAQFDPDFRVRLVQVGTTEHAYVLRMDDPVQRECAVSFLSRPDVLFTSHTGMDVVSVWTALGVDITARNVDTHMLAVMADTSPAGDRGLKGLCATHGMPELAAGADTLDRHFDGLWAASGASRKGTEAERRAYGWNRVSLDEPTYLTYAGLDAVGCRRLAEILVPLTGAGAGLLISETWLSMMANRILIRGLRVDTAAVDALYEEAAAQVEAALVDGASATGGVKINGAKFVPWLAEHGVDWSTWTGALTSTGNPSIAKDNLALLDSYPLDDAGRAAVDAKKRHAGKLDIYNKTKAIKGMLVGDRIHSVLHPMGAVSTARMSSSGWNTQNASKRDPRMRGLFIPSAPVYVPELGRGIPYVLATADFAQVELRVVAALAREQKMIDVIKAGGDLHQLTVDELAEVGVTITRDTAKTTNFLIVYGGGGRALAEQTGMPLDAAYSIVRAWRERYPAVQALSDKLSGLSEIRTVSNRRLSAPVDKRGEPRPYANINYLVQSSARELLVHAWRIIEARYPGVVWFPVHDELVMEIREDLVPEVLAYVESAMRFEFYGVPINADAIVLRDEDGVSRWMTGHRAEDIAFEKGWTR
jgi:DNA polymerase-1